MQIKKIAVIHNDYNIMGGETAVVDNETRLLKKNGIEVLSIIYSNAEIYKLSLLKRIGVLLKSNWNLRTAKQIVKEVKEFNPDLVHIHNFWFMITPAVHFYLKKEGFTIVQTLHNYRLACLNGLFSKNDKPCSLCLKKRNYLHGILYKCYKGSLIHSYLLSRMLKKGRRKGVWSSCIDKYIVLTHFASKKFIEYGLPERKIVVKPNFVICEKSENIHEIKASIFYAGRLSQEKGIHTLIKIAIGGCHNIVVAGEGPMRNELENVQNITLLGYLSQKQINEQMSNVKILLFPTQVYEGMPLVLLEAMANGLPVIASKIGGIPEIIKDGYNGYLIDEPSDYDAFIKKIKILMENESLRMKLSKNAFDTYKEKYNENVNYNMLMEIYQSAIGSVQKTENNY